MAVARAAERPLSRLLPRAVALLGAATLATATIAAVDQRRDAEAAAVQAFRAELRPIAEVVFDHVQPLVEAERQRDDDASGGFSVYVDVARDVSTGNALRAQREAFDDLRVPSSLRRVGDRLDVALERFAEAAGLYEALPFEVTSSGTVSLDEAARVAAGRLGEGLTTWRAAIAAVYAQRPPAVPVLLDDDRAPVRQPVSHPAYLLEAGRACGRTDATGEGEQEEPTDAASVRRAAAAEAAAVRTLVRALLAVPAPPADRVRLEREVLVPLREYGRVAEVLDGLAQTGTDSERLFRELVAADTAGAQLAVGLGDYGSRTCALLLGS